MVDRNTTVHTAHSEFLQRKGLVDILKHAKYKIVGESDNECDTITALEKSKPAILVTDILSENMANYAKRIKEVSNQTRTMLLISKYDEKRYPELLALNFEGYMAIRQSFEADFIENMLKLTLGSRVYCSDLGLDLLEKKLLNPFSELTKREQETLRYIALGFMNREIANKLGMGVRTVETHRKNLMQSLDIHSVAGLTAYALEKGLIDYKEIKEAQVV